MVEIAPVAASVRVPVPDRSMATESLPPAHPHVIFPCTDADADPLLESWVTVLDDEGWSVRGSNAFIAVIPMPTMVANPSVSRTVVGRGFAWAGDGR